MNELRMVLTSLHPKWWRKNPRPRHLPQPYSHPRSARRPQETQL